jgi:death on curing protein
MTTPKWLPKEAVLAMHERQIAEHGGGSGVRSEELLLSALQRPQDKTNYGTPDIADLAAAYAFGISRNHPFIDGNKRTALVAARTFLLYNGFQIAATNESKLSTMLSLAAGTLTEEELALWFRKHLKPI